MGLTLIPVFSENEVYTVKLNIKDEEILLGHIGGFNFQKEPRVFSGCYGFVRF